MVLVLSTHWMANNIPERLPVTYIQQYHTLTTLLSYSKNILYAGPAEPVRQMPDQYFGILCIIHLFGITTPQNNEIHTAHVGG